MKKSNKWKCKLCGEAQSLKKVYGEGSGYECRKHVQHLNLMRKTMDDQIPVGSDEGDCMRHDAHTVAVIDVDNARNHVTSDGCSRWSRYLTDSYTDAADEECDDNDYLSHNASHASLTASSTDPFHGQQAASKFTCRPHPYCRQGKMNSSRSLNMKSQAGIPANDKFTLDDDIENNIMDSKVNKIVDSKVNSGRQQDPAAHHKVAAVTNIDRSSKWSKFLSDDVMRDGSEISSLTVSDCPVASVCSTASLQPFVTHHFPAVCQPMNFVNKSDNISVATNIFAEPDDGLDNLLDM